MTKMTIVQQSNIVTISNINIAHEQYCLWQIYGPPIPERRSYALA